MIDEPTDFQARFRLRMLERMALRAMILSAAQGRSLAEAREASVAWLESNADLTETASETHDHPSLAELYAAEAREVIDDLIEATNALALEMETGRKGD